MPLRAVGMSCSKGLATQFNARQGVVGIERNGLTQGVGGGLCVAGAALQAAKLKPRVGAVFVPGHGIAHGLKRLIEMPLAFLAGEIGRAACRGAVWTSVG